MTMYSLYIRQGAALVVEVEVTRLNVGRVREYRGANTLYSMYRVSTFIQYSTESTLRTYVTCLAPESEVEPLTLH